MARAVCPTGHLAPDEQEGGNESERVEWSGVLCFLHQLLMVNTLTLAILLANVISEQTLWPLFRCPNSWLALHANAVQKVCSPFWSQHKLYLFARTDQLSPQQVMYRQRLGGGDQNREKI